MSQPESKVEKKSGFADTQFSSGDSNTMKPTKQHYQEENNNEIDELSKDLSEMGCIVDAVKRPPNICVETCVYESESEEESVREKSNQEYELNEEDAYSDEFEEDKSETEESLKIEPKLTQSAENTSRQGESSIKLTKSQSFMSIKRGSVSGKSSNYGSVSVPQTRRINMSFSNERLREIERHNHILLSKILSARHSRQSSIPPKQPEPKKLPPSAAVHRKRQQRQIDHDNMILLRKIQRAKSSACSIRR